ncbi:hypothetical protein GCM10007916_34330 [Psychromonas marina]|uniref:Uncharacterized protein n=1 Tax=Psychromonas marina TaxID=88364 RepID=A0ABQ6E4I8_9GAMM|nr:hypothetical protein [Psychromonas marina]GLS92362.1 hypothetical protein GCM10007916_34330 [Psychromonas marina]
MKETLKSLSDIIAQSNDLFYEKNSKLDTVIGIMDKTLRKQGMKADAISVDCIPLNKKIVFLVYDEKPQQIDIAFGNKAGDISSTAQIPIDELTIEKCIEFMVEYFK